MRMQGKTTQVSTSLLYLIAMMFVRLCIYVSMKGLVQPPAYYSLLIGSIWGSITFLGAITLFGTLSDRKHGRYYMVCGVWISIWTTAYFAKPDVLHILLLFLMLAMSIYQDFQLCKEVIKFTVGTYVIFYTLVHLGHIEVSGAMVMPILGIGSVIMGEIIVGTLVGNQERYRRVIMENRRSSQDMLKLVEIKRQEAKEATKAKADFLASMSHEIRTPINAVLGMDEMILRESEQSEILDYARNIQSAGKTLLSIINDTLDFSKIESGKMDIVPVTYELSSVIHDMYVLIGMKARTKGLTFQIDVEENIPYRLRGDEIRIKQVVINLLTNAIKYTDQGTVTLQVRGKELSDGKMELSFLVKDTGRGIQKEDIGHLFDSFRRADQEKNRNIEGTGLGLTIVQRLTEMMNGRVEVESEYGKGSTFSFTLPQEIISKKPIGKWKADEEKNADYSDSYKVKFQAPEARILVVDDNAMNLIVVKGLLRKTRVQIDTAENGPESIKKAKENDYHMILLDHMMPGMDGVEALHEMKKNMERKGKTVPVIALTANAIAGAKEFYIQEGFTDYLSKPIEARKLEAQVYKYIPTELVEYVEESQGTPQEVEEKEKSILWDTGMKYMGDNEVEYRACMRDFATSSMEKQAVLESLLIEENYKEYALKANSFKNIATAIGACQLAALLKEQVKLAKKKKAKEIQQNSNALYEEWENVLTEIRAILQ